MILEYQQELKELFHLWFSQGFVEIYSENHEQCWGRIKSSSDHTSSPGAVPYYIGLFHSRVAKTEVDPLLVLTFDGDVLLVRFMSDHDELFGSVEQKHQPQRLKQMKKTISHWLFGNKD